MLKSACREGFYKEDKFEEYLSILDDMSITEFSLLLLFKKHQDRLLERWETANQANLRDSQWEAFMEEAETHLGIPRDHIDSYLARLSRTGLYESITGVSTIRHLHNGRVTERCQDFCQWVFVTGSD